MRAREFPLILSANGSVFLNWWIGVSYAVHTNMQGHIGEGLSMGGVFPIVTSTKQDLNTHSSTQSYTVGIHALITAVCWTRYFMEAQLYQVMKNSVYQYNKSAILLDNNGKSSSIKRANQINFRFFFITDRISNK